MADLSNTNGYVTKARFEDMMLRVAAYINNRGVTPSLIYIDSSREDYVDWDTYEDMFQRWAAYPGNNGGQWPTKVYFQAPTVTRTVGPIQAKLEAFLGQFNSWTEYYNKIIGRGYGYYYNDVKTLDQEIEALKNKTGLNCTDITQLSVELAKEMGYQTKYVKVQCQSGGHIRMQIKGKEFSDWQRADPAAALSVGSQYPLGKVWCDNNTARVVVEPWLEIDDGI